MTGYANELEVAAVVARDGVGPLNDTARASLTVLNTRLAVEIDQHTQRTFQTMPATTWTRDAPYGPLLLLPDFVTVTACTAYAVDVLAAVVPRTLTPQSAGPPYQALLYAPANVPTGWGGAHATSLNAISLTVTAGWPAPPGGVVQAATRLLCRLWRAQLNLYADMSGDTLTGLMHSAMPLLDDTARQDLMGYVRKPVPTIVSA